MPALIQSLNLLMKNLSLFLLFVAFSLACFGEVRTVFDFAPTQAQFNNFTTSDANNDKIGWEWNYSSNQDFGNYMLCNYNGAKSSDDWVFIPASLEEGESSLTFYCDVRGGDKTLTEKLQICWGTTTSPTDMNLLATETINSDIFQQRSVSFDVAGTSDIFIGLHAISDKDMGGLMVRNLKLEVQLPKQLVNLPFEWKVSDFDKCTVIDGNNDKKTWHINNKGDLECLYHDTNASDDWLILPEFDFTPYAEVSLEFEYSALGTNNPESLEVYQGSSDSADGMRSRQLWTDNSIQTTDWRKASISTSPSYGNYIGFYANSPANLYGVAVRNIRLTGSNTSTSVPVVEAEMPVEYYNLQGLRIAAPQSGELVIVRRGTKVFKTFFR